MVDSKIVAFYLFSGIFLFLLVGKFSPASLRSGTRKDFWVDISYLSLDFLFVLPLNLLLYLSLNWLIKYLFGALGYRTPVGLIADKSYWLQVVILLVVADFVTYWGHRFFHYGWLWRIHSIHHSAVQLNWHSTFRKHPLNLWLPTVLWAPFQILFGANLEPVLMMSFLTSLSELLQHSNLTWGFGHLGKIIMSPKLHRWHHIRDLQRTKYNFGNIFSIWDFIFGTYWLPNDKLASDFGLNDPIPNSLVSQIVYPFEK